MTAQDLKNSIIQLAMQGKLVPQDPNEEPASALLHRVTKANGLKEIPYSSDDIPFDIPETWKWVKLGSLCNYGSCVNIGAIGMPTNFWILELEDIEKDTGRVLSRKSSDSYTTKSTKHVFHSGNVLYSKLRPYLNKVVVAEENGCCTSEILPLDFGEILPRYAQLCLMSPYFVSYANNCSYGVKMPRLGTKDGKNAMFPLAPLQEQTRIVAKIEELLPFVEKYDESEKRLRELNKKFPDALRKAILQQAVQGKLTEQDPNDEPASEFLKRIKAEKARLVKEGKIKKEKPLPPISEEEIPFDIPDNWTWARLSTICRSIADGDHQPPPQTVNGIPFVVISNVVKGFVNLERTRFVSNEYFSSLSTDRIPEKGDILYTVTGSYGVPIVITISEQFCFQRHIALIKPMIDTKFLYWILASPVCKSQADLKSTGIAQKTVGITSLANFLIPLPPIEEQKRITDKVGELLSVCDNL